MADDIGYFRLGFPATNSSIGIVADGMGVDFTWALMFLGRLGIVPALIPGSVESNTYAYQTSRRGWLARNSFPGHSVVKGADRSRCRPVDQGTVPAHAEPRVGLTFGLACRLESAPSRPALGPGYAQIASSQESAGSHRGAAVGMEACLGNAVANDRELEILSEDPL